MKDLKNVPYQGPKKVSYQGSKKKYLIKDLKNGTL